MIDVAKAISKIFNNYLHNINIVNCSEDQSLLEFIINNHK